MGNWQRRCPSFIWPISAHTRMLTPHWETRNTPAQETDAKYDHMNIGNGKELDERQVIVTLKANYPQGE